MKHRFRIAVVGSVHMDLIAHAERLPEAGESVNGSQFAMAAGGKGGNQAAQCAALGAETFIVTQLGDDMFGRDLLKSLAKRGVDTRCISISAEHATGASTVFASAGDYCSIICPGAAAELKPEAAVEALRQLAPLDAVLLQLEMPLPLNMAAAAAANGALLVLNASPALAQLPDALIRHVGLLVVNQTEAARLLAVDAATLDVRDALRGLARLVPRMVVITLGAEGAAGWDGSSAITQKAFATKVVDAVGAGDAFLGALVVQLIAGSTLQQAMRHGAAAGAIAASRSGAASPPTANEISDFLHLHEHSV